MHAALAGPAGLGHALWELQDQQGTSIKLQVASAGLQHRGCSEAGHHQLPVYCLMQHIQTPVQLKHWQCLVLCAPGRLQRLTAAVD